VMSTLQNGFWTPWKRSKCRPARFRCIKVQHTPASAVTQRKKYSCRQKTTSLTTHVLEVQMRCALLPGHNFQHQLLRWGQATPWYYYAF
jgi:hypothetical protein